MHDNRLHNRISTKLRWKYRMWILFLAMRFVRRFLYDTILLTPLALCIHTLHQVGFTFSRRRSLQAVRIHAAIGAAQSHILQP